MQGQTSAGGPFDGFFDDAALFPPGDAAMAAAVPAHRRLRERFGALVGPFVVPAARLDELTGQLGAGPPLPVSVIVPDAALPAAVQRVTADTRLALAGVELPVVADAGQATAAVRALDALPDGLPAAVEVPRTGARDAVLDVLAGTPYRAKLRTGGLRPELFPGPDELAAALHACIGRRIPVKCTAGLHHAVRHTDPATGFTHHGFLNVLAAVDALLTAIAAGSPDTGGPDTGDPGRNGPGPDESGPAGPHGGAAADATAMDVATGLLADTDTVVERIRALPASRLTAARGVFTSFGTCSVVEPIDDLVALGLLPTSERIDA